MTKNIPIFFGFDDNYVIPAAVAFNSLLEKAKAGVFYNMYVLHDNITAQNQQLLSDIAAKNGNGKLEFVNTKGFLEDEWKNKNFSDFKNDKTFTSAQFTKEALYKCFAARFFPQYEVIIYSDVDVIFTDDVSELIDVDFEDKYYIAAVKNFLNYNEEVGHLSHLPGGYEKFRETYFAGGIWVLNNKLIRRDNIEQKMLDVINDTSIYKKWPDQDVMNIVVYDKVKYLSLRYISYPYLYDFMGNNPNAVFPYTHDEIMDSLDNPKILHYAAVKPWNDYTSNKADIWFKECRKLGLYKKWMKNYLKKYFVENLKNSLFRLKISKGQVSLTLLGLDFNLSSKLIGFYRKTYKCKK